MRDDDLRSPLRNGASSQSSYREVQYLSIPGGSGDVRRSSSATRQGNPVYEVDIISRRASNIDLGPARPPPPRSRSPSFQSPSVPTIARPPPSIRRQSSSDGSLKSRKFSAFQYKPLDRSVKGAIRILRVYPERENGYISCKLSHSDIKATYSALSYTWASSSKSSGEETTEVILLNGKPFPVRDNLHAFLKYARRHLADRPLWVDAISINQEDVTEKNRQVGMMWKIYSFTKEVLVWLGPSTRDTEHVGHAIKKMKEYSDTNDVSMALSSAGDDDFWRGFRDINQAFYWDRVWVIQEFTLPSHGRIIQGNDWISFTSFQDTIRRFDNKIYRGALNNVVFSSKRRSDFKDYMSNIHPLWQRRLSYKENSSRTHKDADWTTLSGVRHCQDLRDRVYGIMALSTHGNTLRVNYNLNPFQLLLESIWLEHDSDIDRTDIVMNLANILLLTPAAICMYAHTATPHSKYLLHKCDLSRRHNDIGELEAIHIKAAASNKGKRRWLETTMSDGKEVYWRNFASVKDRGSLKVPKGWPVFPSRKQCPWQMFVYTVTKEGRWGLKLAIDAREVDAGRKGRERSRSRDRDRRRSSKSRRRGSRSRSRSSSERSRRAATKDPKGAQAADSYMSPTEFMEVNAKRATALGMYRTTCAPVEMTVYYALAEGLEGVGPADNRAGALEEVLEHLEF